MYYSSDLQRLADKAVDIREREKVSAVDAVSRAVSGEGLNSEQLHRVSTMANRTLLGHAKKSATEEKKIADRWETSKPDRIAEIYRDGSEKSGVTTKELRDLQFGSIFDAVKRAPVGGDGTDDLCGGTDTDKEMCPVVGSDSLFAPSTKTSAIDPVDLAVGRLRSFMGTPLPPRAKTSAPSHAVETLRALRIDILTAMSLADGRATAAHLEKSSALSGLAEEVCQMEYTGFTFGEAMLAVKRSFATLSDAVSAEKYMAATVPAAAAACCVNLDAVVGDSRDDRGNLKTSEVAREQQRLLIRPEVAAATVVDKTSAIFKLSEAYLNASVEADNMEDAHRKLAEQLEEVTAAVHGDEEDCCEGEGV